MAGILLQTVEEFNEMFETTESFLLIKHSLTCPISKEAFREYETFCEQSPLPTYYLHVQEARPLSNYIAEQFGIKHESPQALLFQNGKVVWHDSHWNITAAKLKEAIQ